MGRYATFSETLLAQVRRYFGLTQAELARWLGLSRVQTGYLETGQRTLTPAAAAALAPLARALPPQAPALPLRPGPPSAADLAPPDAAPLRRRLRYCRHHARRLRLALVPLETQAAYAARWRLALPQVRAALPPDPGGADPPAIPPGPARRAAFLGWFRHRWLATRLPALPPDLSARYHLLRLQAEALETEAGALAQLLGEP